MLHYFLFIPPFLCVFCIFVLHLFLFFLFSQTAFPTLFCFPNLLLQVTPREGSFWLCYACSSICPKILRVVVNVPANHNASCQLPMLSLFGMTVRLQRWNYCLNISKSKTCPSPLLATSLSSTKPHTIQQEWAEQQRSADRPNPQGQSNACATHGPAPGQHCVDVHCHTSTSAVRKGKKSPLHQKRCCTWSFEKSQLEEFESKWGAKPILTISPAQYTHYQPTIWNKMQL